jgi:FAD binding domain
MEEFLSVDPVGIGRPDVPPSSDAVDERLVGGTPEGLKTDLIELLGKDLVRHRISDLVRYASDASPYRYIPNVVVQPKNIDHVAAIFRYCIRKGRHATFRAGGTSLNGQAQGNDILIDVRQHWSGWKVEDNGSRIRCNVGTTLGRINEVLKSYARRMGPDPASMNAATIGGVLATNAGGMRCPPAIDSYHSIIAMKIVLTTGTIIDTEDPHAEERFAASEPEMAAGLLKIREEMLADKEISDRVTRKYGIRNTNGYAMHAFLDGQTPLEILRRLMVGSEGTLGFVAEAVYKTYYKRGQTWMSEQMSDALWRWSDGGKLPVVVDAASCTLGLKDDLLEHLDDERKDRLKLITVVDSIAWCKDLLPSLSIHKTIPKILVHPTCSTTHLGLSETLLEIANVLADRAEIPLGTTCCGTAGDRGLLHPELVLSATRDTLVQIQSSGNDTRFVCANRTCELGMRQATGKVYESFIYALEEATRLSE